MGITRPLERSVEVAEIGRMRHAPQVELERHEAVGHFANALGERTSDRVRAAAAVCGAERLRQSIRTYRKHGVGPTRLSAVHKAGEKFRRNFRHITGHNQIPLGLRDSKGCIDASQGATTGKNILHNGITKVSITAGVSDQSYVTRGYTGLRCNKFHQWPSLKWEQGFVATHAGTLPARQDKRRAFHNGEMITL